MTPDLVVTLSPGSTEIVLELETFADNGLWGEVWDPALRAFSGLVEQGGFTGSPSLPQQVLSIEPITQQARRYRLLDKGIQFGAWRILANICIARSAWCVPLSRLSFSFPPSACYGRAIGTASDLLTIPYPCRPNMVQFPCEIEASVYLAGALTMRVEWNRPVERSTADWLFRLFDDWTEVANGGYPDERGRAEECVIQSSGPYRFDRNTLETSLPFFNASDAAWESVISVLSHCDRTDNLIRAFSVSP